MRMDIQAVQLCHNYVYRNLSTTIT